MRAMMQQRDERRLQLEDDDDRAIASDDQEPAQRRVHAGEEAALIVPVMYARTASAPATRVAPANQASRRAPVGRRVEPGREHGEERQRPVEIVEAVRRAVVVGEEQQPEPDLRDEQRLGEREQVRHEPARLAAAVVREPGERPRRPRSRRGRGMRRCDGPLASAAERYREDLPKALGARGRLTVDEDGRACRSAQSPASGCLDPERDACAVRVHDLRRARCSSSSSSRWSGRCSCRSSAAPRPCGPSRSSSSRRSCSPGMPSRICRCEC